MREEREREKESMEGFYGANLSTDVGVTWPRWQRVIACSFTLNKEGRSAKMASLGMRNNEDA